jgi:ribosomal protein S18 acetylase RimI-like enzyme
MEHNFLIREYRDKDFDAVTILWRVAREKLLPKGQTDTGHYFYEDRDYFRNQIMKKDRIWVVEIDHHPAAFIAMENEFIDQLYVHPDYQRGGIGRALLEFARRSSPQHLWLYTLQSNVNAQAFYEKNGFVAAKFGVSPEGEPDVEYHWRRS